MPELPDLEVIREYLAPRLLGVTIASAMVRRPIIVRNLLGDDFAAHMAGRAFVDVRRRGKFLLLGLDDGTALVINPMLAGRLRYGEPLKKDRVRDALVLRLDDGRELRYHDAEDMGKIYLTLDLGQVPTFTDLGPEANDPDLTLDIFLQRLRRHPGEIKGILTNQEFVAGIGSAYADEICWRAGIYPFRRRGKPERRRIGAASRGDAVGVGRSDRHAAGARRRRHRCRGARLSGRPRQAGPALSPLRQPHQRGVARAPRHALLPDVPAGADDRAVTLHVPMEGGAT